MYYTVRLAYHEETTDKPWSLEAWSPLFTLMALIACV